MDTDFDKVMNLPKITTKHAHFLPSNIFMILAGPTGCGKTNLLFNFLLNGNLNYCDVYIYSTTLDQPKYQYLKKYYSDREAKLRNIGISHKITYFFDSDEEIKKPSELDPNASHIMIFDDVMNEDQKLIKDYFTKGRHYNTNVFYLCQSFHTLPKHGIRQNANIFIFFEQDDKTMKYIYDTHISADMDFKEFKGLYGKAWSKRNGYLVINLWEEPICGKYIVNYKEIYVPSKYIKIHKNT